MPKRALLVIDVQMIYFSGKLKITYPGESFSNILKAMEQAGAKGVAVVLVQHSSSALGGFSKGSPEWELHPEVFRLPHDVLFEKTMPGSFTGTGLEPWLKKQGIDTVTICGYMSQMCCDTTARQAAELGFAVEFLSDATGTLPVSNSAGSVSAEELHRAVLVTQAMRFSKVLTTKEWIENL